MNYKKTTIVINITYYQCLKKYECFVIVYDKSQFTFMTKIKLEIIINLIYDFFSKTCHTVLVPLPYQDKQIDQC